VLAQYEEKDSLKRLDNLFRFQSVTGQYQDARPCQVQVPVYIFMSMLLFHVSR
jgi:hypothetical protein